LALWLLAAVCAAPAAVLISALATRPVVDPWWSVLGLVDAFAFIVGTVLLALAASRARKIGTVVLASEEGVRVLTGHETFTRRLGLTRLQNLLWGGRHRFAWNGIERFALRGRVEAVFAKGKRRRLAIRGSLPLVHWLNDMLVLYTT
jgi:hypothetical protein